MGSKSTQAGQQATSYKTELVHCVFCDKTRQRASMNVFRPANMASEYWCTPCTDDLFRRASIGVIAEDLGITLAAVIPSGNLL